METRRTDSFSEPTLKKEKKKKLNTYVEIKKELADKTLAEKLEYLEDRSSRVKRQSTRFALFNVLEEFIVDEKTNAELLLPKNKNLLTQYHSIQTKLMELEVSARAEKTTKLFLKIDANNLKAAVKYSDDVSYYGFCVEKDIVFHADPLIALERWIRIMEMALKAGDYHTAMTIQIALNQDYILNYYSDASGKSKHILSKTAELIVERVKKLENPYDSYFVQRHAMVGRKIIPNMIPVKAVLGILEANKATNHDKISKNITLIKNWQENLARETSQGKLLEIKESKKEEKDRAGMTVLEEKAAKKQVKSFREEVKKYFPEDNYSEQDIYEFMKSKQLPSSRMDPGRIKAVFLSLAMLNKKNIVTFVESEIVRCVEEYKKAKADLEAVQIETSNTTVDATKREELKSKTKSLGETFITKKDQLTSVAAEYVTSIGVLLRLIFDIHQAQRMQVANKKNIEVSDRGSFSGKEDKEEVNENANLFGDEVIIGLAGEDKKLLAELRLISSTLSKLPKEEKIVTQINTLTKLPILQSKINQIKGILGQSEEDKRNEIKILRKSLKVILTVLESEKKKEEELRKQKAKKIIPFLDCAVSYASNRMIYESQLDELVKILIDMPLKTPLVVAVKDLAFLGSIKEKIQAIDSLLKNLENTSSEKEQAVKSLLKRMLGTLQKLQIEDEMEYKKTKLQEPPKTGSELCEETNSSYEDPGSPGSATDKTVRQLQRKDSYKRRSLGDHVSRFLTLTYLSSRGQEPKKTDASPEPEQQPKETASGSPQVGKRTRSTMRFHKPAEQQSTTTNDEDKKPSRITKTKTS